MDQGLLQCWDLLKEEIQQFMHEFYFNAKLPKALTSSFIALIPKKNNPQSLLESYHHISLILNGDGGFL